MALFSKKYENEWRKSDGRDSSQYKSFYIPYFSPLPGNKIVVTLEVTENINDSTPAVSVFKLKVSMFHITPPLKVSIDVKVNYSDGSLFVEYPNMASGIVETREEFIFNDVIRVMTDKSGYPSEHNIKMASRTVIIKCSMTFYGELQTSHIAPAVEMKSSKYVDLTRNLISLYEPSVLSDFTFKVGDRSFPAHKVILAAHSPVFMKMMTQEFLESKTNTVIITDTTPEIFDVFLRFLYSGEIGEKSWNSLKELYYLADKYDIGFLKKECIFTVMSVLSVDSVCQILTWAYSYSDTGLRNVAINFAFNHIKELASRNDWKELVKTQPLIGYDVTANFISK